MRCSKCGNNIPDCCSFCYICGTKVKKQSANVAGTVYSNVSNASTVSGEVKYGATRGHGLPLNVQIICMTQLQERMHISLEMIMPKTEQIDWLMA